MKKRSAIWNAILILYGLFWAGVLIRVAKYPDPHLSVNILFAIPLFAIGAAVGIQRRWTIVVWLSVASIVGVWALYQFNVLVPYEVWLRRGMPERPF